jgi:hypothetical protein
VLFYLHCNCSAKPSFPEEKTLAGYPDAREKAKPKIKYEFGF